MKSADRFLLMIAVMLNLTVSGSVVPLRAQVASQTLVAVPGESFGPLKIGEAPPSGWDIVCKHSEPRPSYEYTRASEFYYAKLGLGVTVPTAEFQGPAVILRGRIMAIFANPNVVYNPGPSRLFPECTRSDGEAVNAGEAPKPPDSTTYRSNRGAGLGSTLQEVVAAHGDRYNVFLGGSPVRYCGIGFFLDGDRKVSQMIVAHPQLWPDVFRAHCGR